jgi:hypothetical protein
MLDTKALVLRLLSLFVVACFLIPIGAHADEPQVPVPASLLSPSMPQGVRDLLIIDADQDAAVGRSMVTAGVVLSVIGTVLTFAGPGLMIHDALCDRCTSSNIPAAIAMTTIGPTSILVGVPIAIAGGYRRRKGERARVVLTGNGFQF